LPQDWISFQDRLEQVSAGGNDGGTRSKLPGQNSQNQDGTAGTLFAQHYIGPLLNLGVRRGVLRQKSRRPFQGRSGGPAIFQECDEARADSARFAVGANFPVLGRRPSERPIPVHIQIGLIILLSLTRLCRQACPRPAEGPGTPGSIGNNLKCAWRRTKRS